MTNCPRCNGQMLHAAVYNAYPSDAQERRCLQCGYTQETHAPTPQERSTKRVAYHHYQHNTYQSK